MKLSVSFLNDFLSSPTQRVHLRWTVSYDPEGPPYDPEGPPYDPEGPPYDPEGPPYDPEVPPYTVCEGTFDMSLSFSGHFILVCLNSKQAPVESLYWTLFTFSGLGYTKILRFSGLNI